MPNATTAQTTTPVETPSKVLPFKVGADPEFLLFHGTRALDASNIIKNFFENSGLRSGYAGYKIPDIGEFGWDGASSTGELRPNASNDPEQVTKNLGVLIKKMHEKMPFLDFTTLSIGSPIGGHIHLDAPVELCSNNLNEKQAKTTARINKLLASFIMPIVASEHRISSTSRLSMGYGKPDDIRWETHGGGNNTSFSTAEVRGMSAEWLTSPKIAHATLAYLGVVWHELLKHNEELIKDRSVLKTKGHIVAVHQMMLSDYKLIENAIVRGLAKSIRQFELYPMYKNEVEFILHPRSVLEEKERVGWNLGVGWGISSQTTQPTKKILLSPKAVSEAVKKKNNPSLDNNFTMAYNDDFNVALFASSISERVGSLNWRLKNEYFLFGLKKGIEGYAAMNGKSGKFYAVPTNNPHEETKNSCDRMKSRFLNNNSNSLKIDPKTGRTRFASHDAIIIGIPYDARADAKTTGLIELIWNIENNRITPEKVETFPVTLPVQNKDSIDIERIIDDAATRGNGNTITIANIDRETLRDLLPEDNQNTPY